jgi:hypothetical protein
MQPSFQQVIPLCFDIRENINRRLKMMLIAKNKFKTGQHYVPN